MDDAIVAEKATQRDHAHGMRSILTKVEALPGDRVSFGDMAKVLGDQGLALGMLIFALPNCLPAPPGLGSILGLPLFLIAFNLFRGRPIWLPAFIAKRSAAKKDLLRILTKAMDVAGPLERRLRPRLTGLMSPLGEKAIAVFVMLLALMIALPFPLTNLVPAIGTAIISLGMTEQDGVVVLLGVVVGIAGLVLGSTVLAAFVVAPLLVLGHT